MKPQLPVDEDGGSIVLASPELQVRLVPGAGGRVASLLHLRTGREWLWRPRPRFHFPRVETGAPFGSGPLTGIDECLPTIEACEVNGRRYGDHGDVWTQAWTVQAATPAAARLEVKVPGGGLVLTRSIALVRESIRFDYTLRNAGEADEPWLWSWHPLFRFEDGDRFELPPGTTTLRVSAAANLPGAPAGAEIAWPSPLAGVDLSRLDFGSFAPGFLKAFAENVTEGRASIHAASGRERLEIRFDPQLTPHLGIWITHGGWKGVRHGAIEPCTQPADRLDLVRPLPLLPPGGERRWWVELSLHPV